MIAMHLVIDHEGMSLSSGTSPEMVAQHLDVFSRVLYKIRADGGIRWMHNDLYDVRIVDDISLIDLIYGEFEWLDRDLRNVLIEQLGQCKDLESGQDPVQQVDEWLEDKIAAGCVILPSGQSRANLPVMDMKTLLEFYRRVPELTNCNEAEYIQHAILAFPDLHFKPGIENEFRHFSEGFPIMRKKITKVASVLSDKLSSLLRQCSGNRVLLEQHLTREIGYPTSPESVNTHQNSQAMRQRNADFDGRTVCCEWHVKFKPREDRLHFHQGIPGIANGKSLICHFTEHFDL